MATHSSILAWRIPGTGEPGGLPSMRSHRVRHDWRLSSSSSSSAGKESTCDAGDPGSIPGSGRSPEEGIDYPLQYSWASLVAQLVKNLPVMWQTWVWSLGWEDPRRRERLPTPVFWPGEFHGLYSPWGHKESDTTEQLSLPLNVRIKLKKLYLKKKGVAYFTCACRGTAHPAPWNQDNIVFQKGNNSPTGKKLKEYYPSET